MKEFPLGVEDLIISFLYKPLKERKRCCSNTSKNRVCRKNKRNYLFCTQHKKLFEISLKHKNPYESVVKKSLMLKRAQSRIKKIYKPTQYHCMYPIIWNQNIII